MDVTVQHTFTPPMKLPYSCSRAFVATIAITLLLTAAAAELRAQATTNWTRPATGVWYWGNPNNWTDGVPGPGINAVIPIDFASVYIDIAASANNLTIQQRARIDSVPGFDLNVFGITTLSNPASGTYAGGEIQARSGSVFSLGTLANFSNGILTGSYRASDAGCMPKSSEGGRRTADGGKRRTPARNRLLAQ
jgi:hypothetical protein